MLNLVSAAVCRQVEEVQVTQRREVMLFREAIPQTDEEEQVGLPTTKTWPWSRAVLAVLVAGLFMALMFAGMNSKGSKGSKDYEFDALHALQALDEFKIPELPANPIQEAKEKALAPLNEVRDKYGINVLRKDEIALCVTNLNLGLWKLVQLGAILAETQVNCPAGFTNIDKKIACNINIAAVVAATSAATSFFASSAFLCTGRANPDAECTTVLAATFEQLATFPASENQIALFCPKNAYEETIVRGGVPVYAAAARLRRLANDANASRDSRGLQDAEGSEGIPIGPTDPVELVFCTWEIAQTLWFISRAGPLIEIATKRCPADKSSHAACSELINEILTMFFNAAKFIAAATTNCIDGMNVAAGCSLGTLNFISAITGSGSVISALADGVCSDLGPRRKAATEEQVNRKINKINLVRSKTLRRLLREKKISGGAVAEASKLIAEAEKSPATVQKFFHGLQTDRAHVHALALSHLRSLKSSPLTEARWLYVSGANSCRDMDAI